MFVVVLLCIGKDIATFNIFMCWWVNLSFLTSQFMSIFVFCINVTISIYVCVYRLCMYAWYILVIFFDSHCYHCHYICLYVCYYFSQTFLNSMCVLQHYHCNSCFYFSWLFFTFSNSFIYLCYACFPIIHRLHRKIASLYMAIFRNQKIETKKRKTQKMNPSTNITKQKITK